MKRCPECRRDYLDDTLSFCLEDGMPLVHGVSPEEPATVILPATEQPGVAATQAQIPTTNRTAILPSGTGDAVLPHRVGLDKRMALPE
jgi:hypothetical protein